MQLLPSTLLPPELFPLQHVHSGKVRDTYTRLTLDFPELLLPVSSDRLSTHNIVHLSEILGKGEILTAQTHFWSVALSKINIETHIYASGKNIEGSLPEGLHGRGLHLRSFVVRKLAVPRVEFIYRNHLVGSLWEYYKNGLDPYGLKLPKGLKYMHRFKRPVFTPTQKSENDEPMNADEVRAKYPDEYAFVRKIFVFMSSYLEGRKVRLIDSKYKVGHDENGKLLLADEFGTSDSSRFSSVREAEKAMNLHTDPAWLDKQVFREYAQKKWKGGKKFPLEFSPDVIEKGIERYHRAFKLITGETLESYQKKFLS